MQVPSLAPPDRISGRGRGKSNVTGKDRRKRVMNWQWWLNLAYWWGIPLVLMIIFVRLGQKNLKRIDEYYKKTFTNQEEVIAILK